MQIQLNTDKHIVGSPKLLERVQQAINHELRFVSNAITRVEVHLNDINGDKGGDNDKRCLLEARIAGMKPVIAEHRAANIDLAVNGAASQLARVVKTTLAKSDTHVKGGASIRHTEQNSDIE